MTWITPLEAPTSAFRTFALLIFTDLPLALTLTDAPLSVLIELRFTTL